LESIQVKHDEEISNLQSELEESNESKEHFEIQYKSLLGRVNTIKTSLGDRLKADAVGPCCPHRSLVRVDECILAILT
jgi:predicted transcriptional regulator